MDNKNTKVFVLGIPHSLTLDPAHSPFSTCAFSTKVYYLCRMLTELGYHVVHLGNEGSKPICTEHVSLAPAEMWHKLYGKRDVAQNYDLREDGPNKEFIDLFTSNMRKGIQERMGTPYTNIICVPWGGCQRRAVEDLPQLVVESGIGYPYSWAKYRVYESYAWYHNRMGKEGISGDAWQSVVIPNARDPEAYGPVVPREKKGNYFLMICRLNKDKGVEIAVQVCQKLGVPLKLCGQGDPSPFLGPGVTYMKPRGMEELRDTIRYAKGLFSPTRYIEPFGTISIEALLAGTPVITTDWGCYTETVPHGLVGYRCRTMGHFLWAAKNIDKIDPYVCREWAEKNFSLEKIKPQYHEFFQSLLKLNTSLGWNDPEDDRLDMDFLKKDFSMFGGQGQILKQRTQSF